MKRARKEELETAVPHEAEWARRWREAKLFEADPDPSKPKFFITVPYSYQNGPLHLGHGFTFTRGDAYARFKRMQGYNVLFPWAWHWTGEAVAGTSERLKRGDETVKRVLVEIDGVPPEILDKFTDPTFISKYYTEENRKVVDAMGYSVDWRREFHTTDLHPYYSKFIEWQYLTLRKRGYVTMGKHPVVWCPSCKSPTGDHDRLVGEGVSPEEYTLVFFRLGDAYLAAATLRPETIFGATNLWVNPEHPYALCEVEGVRLIVAKRAVEKLREQKPSIKVIREMSADELIGKEVEVPLTGARIPIFPARFVDPDFGTGVVYSVPGHAPYDYAGLITLRANQEWLDKYGIREAVEKIKPISIISVPGYRDYPAVEEVERRRITTDTDKKLEEATKEVYLKEFHEGVMKENCGEYAGKPVNEARGLVKEKLIEEKLGDVMWELPEKVVCRCGTQCLVKIVENQWFIRYSDEKWKKLVKSLIESMKIYPEEARQWFLNVVDWLRDWACARKTGLGTRLPWDPDWMVETLSDSTIYPALYTISKYLNRGQVKPSQLTFEVLNYVFLGEGDTRKIAAKVKLEVRKLKAMREEFLYWYPVDMRLSAKDLVPNHLTFYLFHHTAIFKREQWPRSVGVNGIISIEGKKMSKSAGNFIPLKTAIARHGADATRCTLLLAAEDMDDPDWREKNAEEVKLMIEQFLRTVREVAEANLVDETPADKWLLSRLQRRIRNITSNMDVLKTRKACHEALYGLYGDWRWYLRRSRGAISRAGKLFVETWVKLLAPFIPFTCEEAWRTLNKDGFVSRESWPIVMGELINPEAELAEELVMRLMEDTRSILEVLEKKPEKICVYVASPGKLSLLEAAINFWKQGEQKNVGALIREFVEVLPEKLKKQAPILARLMLDTVSSLTPNYKPKTLTSVARYEAEIYKNAHSFLEEELRAQLKISVEDEENIYDPKGKAEMALPLRPGIYVE